MTKQKIVKMKKKEEVEIKNDLIEAVKSKKTFTEIGINEQLVKAALILLLFSSIIVQDHRPNAICVLSKDRLMHWSYSFL